MAEDFGYGYGRYRDDHDNYDDHDDAAYEDDEGDAADYDDADHADHAAADYDNAGLLTDEPVGDEGLLTAAVDEPVSDMVDDPAANESPDYERFRRMRRRTWDLRKKSWVPPDLRRYRQPVFYPVEEPDKAPGTGME